MVMRLPGEARPSGFTEGLEFGLELARKSTVSVCWEASQVRETLRYSLDGAVDRVLS
jgi:hypothetical protein